MWNIIIPFANELNLYMVFALFIMYSFFGWLVESIYMSICNKQITNRGFVHGPLCPIYGVGALIVYLLLYPFSENYIILYIVGAMLATLVEFLTALLMIRVFGYVWWDYTNKPFNYKGILCLESSIAWGFYIIIQFVFLHNLMLHLISLIPVNIGKLLIIGLLLYYIIDFAYCFLSIKKGDVTPEENNILAVTSDKN